MASHLWGTLCCGSHLGVVQWGWLLMLLRVGALPRGVVLQVLGGRSVMHPELHKMPEMACRQR
jgi:hypothetical protein